MARDGVPQGRPPGPGETTGERPAAARHTAERQQQQQQQAARGRPPGTEQDPGTDRNRDLAQYREQYRERGGERDWDWDEAPGWLDEDAPLDPAGDERDWPTWAELEEARARAEVDGAEAQERVARLILHEMADAVAHVPGAPRVPGVKAGPGGGFGQAEPLDTALPEPGLAWLADTASGEARMFPGVSDDELCGLIGARQRLAARQDWEMLAALAELIGAVPRRAAGCRGRG